MATYTVTATIPPDARGSISNVASADQGTSGAVLYNTTDDSATAVIDLTPEVDISVTKTDGVTSVAPGDSTTYTMIVSNAGPSSATDVRVTGAACRRRQRDVDMHRGHGRDVRCGEWDLPDRHDGRLRGRDPGRPGVILGNAADESHGGGSLTNTVSADAPADVTETNSANNQATDVDTLTPQSDVSVTKTDGLTSIAAGHSLPYTITVSSGGPSEIDPVAVDDDLPAGLTATTWTCAASSGSSCTAGSGVGSIHSSVDLLVGGSATYTVAGTVTPTFRGTLSNTLTATLPGGATDPTPANNSATDVTTVVGETDLSVTKTDDQTTVVPGTSTTYTIVVSNAGPSTAINAPVTDTLDAALTNATWTCAATTGSSCDPASGNGSSRRP